MHLKGAGTSSLAALAALKVLHGMLLTAVDEGSSTSAASTASPTSLHGVSPLSLVFSSFQLRCGGVAAELELSCSILSTCESDPSNVLGVREGVRRGWLERSDSRH